MEMRSEALKRELNIENEDIWGLDKRLRERNESLFLRAGSLSLFFWGDFLGRCSQIIERFRKVSNESVEKWCNYWLVREF